MRRWPPPPATCSTMCWETGRIDTRSCCGGRSTGNVLDNVLGVGGEIREGAAEAAYADTVLGVGEEEYEKMRRWPPPSATCSTLCWESGRRSTRGAAVTASAGNVLDTVLRVGEEKYLKLCSGRLRRKRAREVSVGD